MGRSLRRWWRWIGASGDECGGAGGVVGCIFGEWPIRDGI